MSFRNVLRASATVIILAFASSVVLSAGPGRDDSDAAHQIRKVLDEQVEAWNRRDLEGFMNGYWRSSELTFFSGGTVTSGWDATLARYRQRYQSQGREMGRLAFLDLKIELLGPEAAFVRGRYNLKMSSSEAGGLFTLTFRKLPAGWRIIHDHTSS
jgi:beta-aspartyl-peptidase (threonine type)